MRVVVLVLVFVVVFICMCYGASFFAIGKQYIKT